MLERIEPGGWTPPRWLGVEPKPMMLIVGVGLLAFLTHNIAFIIVAFAVAVGSWLAFTMMAEVDPRLFEIVISNRTLLTVRRVDRLPVHTSPRLRPPNVTR